MQMNVLKLCRVSDGKVKAARGLVFTKHREMQMEGRFLEAMSVNVMDNKIIKLRH